ncbi:MAG: LacI family DNA-binding transcriptional regulator [Bacteroidales bacterium]|jgi:DNA-binding LacI/PurR family transcriptional regulator|nr:LacI family DNA-binding transcriptional regulator [Bacteroidales bacterium]
MSSKQVTIKDIARELNISPSTVSRALKDHPDISQPTKDKIQKLVDKYHYRPNAVALNLRRGKSNVIGVIIPEIVHHFFSSVISGIEEVVQARGYSVMLCQSSELYEREVLNSGVLLSSRVEGVLASISKETVKVGHFEDFLHQNIPLVFFDRIAPSIETDRVVVDDYNGAFKATEYLIKTGCKRIAHLSASQHLQIGYQRKRGYISALEKNRLEVDDDIIVFCDKFDKTLEVIPQIMDRPDPPDAIFCVNDLTAAATLKALKKLNYRVPEDVSVIGFTDGLVSTVTDPALTTISQHGFHIGRRAAEILFYRINNEDTKFKAKTEIIPTELVIRESTRALKK